MPIGTSDGQYYETEMEQVSQAPAEPQPQEAFDVAAQRIAKSVVHENKPERDIPIANAVMRLGNGLLEFAKFPGKVYNGEVDIQSEEGKKQAADWAAAMALNMTFTPAPLASKAVDGTLGSIAGVSAKTTNKSDLAMAKAMDEKGFHPDQVWDATGFYKGIDNKWRFEIPSTEAKLKIPAHGQPMNLDGVFDFPSLYEAYPQLRTIEFKLNSDMNFLGSYVDKTIEINPELHRSLKINPIETILHEVQHAIQSTEKFPLGTNPDWAYQQFIRSILLLSFKR
jgi:hypothetical protein